MVLLMAGAVGLAVATLYYNQPLLGELAAGIGATPAAVGLVPTATQLGYGLGILLLAPLGDRFERRRIILVKAALLCAALVAAALAPGIGMLLAASLVIGVSATLAQDLVPAAATLAPEAHRGKVVGSVMTGLLLGILLSRVVSGWVAQQFGWRAIFAAAAVSIALMGVALWRGLPRLAPTSALPYGALLASLAALWRRHGALRRAVWAQGLLSVSFSAFWSTLAVMLHAAPFHLGSAVAGAFGLAGAAGALAAPLAGRAADRRGPDRVARLAAALVLASFVAMLAMPWLGTGAALALLVVCAVGFDLGVQMSLIAHQTLIYGLDAGARSRLTAILITGGFIGMAAGSALGAQAFARWGWRGVTGVAIAAAAGALIVRLWPARPVRIAVEQA